MFLTVLVVEYWFWNIMHKVFEGRYYVIELAEHFSRSSVLIDIY